MEWWLNNHTIIKNITPGKCNFNGTIELMLKKEKVTRRRRRILVKKGKTCGATGMN
jgi:hypothetical protein